MIQALLRRKGVYETINEDETIAAEYAAVSSSGDGGLRGAEGGLAKTLTAADIIAYGIGSTVGAGLFVVTGRAAKEFAGPGVTLSFLLAGLSCSFSALCYAELASAIPVSGSAYSYAYVTLGEAAAWFIGWNLTLEYGVSASAVARGWAAYVTSFCESIGMPLPGAIHGFDVLPGTILSSASPLAAGICLVCTAVLMLGAKESSRLNLTITAVNVVVIAFIVAVGASRLSPANWHPFAPHGVSGILSGASYVFFSFIGFDAVCTLGEECRDPQRDMPVGIIGSLVVVSALYVLVTLVVTGMVPVPLLDPSAPLATAFSQVGLHWAAQLVAFGSVTILSATTFCSLFGQPRIFLAMSRDGLLPPALGRISSRTHVPSFGTLFSGAASAVLAFFLDIDTLTDVISIGTLSAFAVVCISVLHLRYCHKDGNPNAPPPQPAGPPSIAAPLFTQSEPDASRSATPLPDRSASPPLPPPLAHVDAVLASPGALRATPGHARHVGGSSTWDEGTGVHVRRASGSARAAGQAEARDGLGDREHEGGLGGRGGRASTAGRESDGGGIRSRRRGRVEPGRMEKLRSELGRTSAGSWIALFVLLSFGANLALQSLLVDSEGGPRVNLGSLAASLWWTLPMLAVCALPVIALWISRGPGEGPASGGRGAEVELGPSARHRGAAWGEGGVDAPWGEPSGSLESERETQPLRVGRDPESGLPGALRSRGVTPSSRNRGKDSEAARAGDEGEAAGPSAGLLRVGAANEPAGQPFRTPLVPWVPCLGIWINMHLITGLKAAALWRMVLWTLLGFAFYGLYGVWHSKLRSPSSAYLHRSS